MLSRRTLISAAGSTAMLAACGQNGTTDGPAKAGELAVQAAARKIDKVGLQSYTLREALSQDFEGTFKMIKDIGYDYVELNDRNFSERTPAQLKAILDDLDLPSPASHIGYDRVINDTDAVIAAGKTLGAKYMIVPYMAEDQRSLEDWKRHAKALNAAGERFADAGLRLAYHNHQFEFDDLGGGTTALEILMTEASADNLDFELDIFWTTLAQINVPDLLRKYPGRFKLCHVKDMKGDPTRAPSLSYEEIGDQLMANVGEGDTDFEAIFALNDISGLEYFIAEHDHPKRPFGNSIANSLIAIREMRF